MSQNNVNEAEYEKLRNLLRFYYAQYRYNLAAGGAGGVGKVPHPDANTSQYDLKENLAQFHLEKFQRERLQIGNMQFEIIFCGQRGQMGSDPNTFIWLCGTTVGLYLHQSSSQGHAGAKTNKPFEDFFTWDNPYQEPTTLYVGEGGKAGTNYNKYGSYKFADLGLGESTPITDQLKDLYAKLQKLNVEAKEAQHEPAERIPTPPEEQTPAPIDVNVPHNWILFGAPGTGKSYTINKNAEQYPRRRVTFHPDYTYAQFVGSYKPVVSEKSGSGITYSFVPGPFIETLMGALDEPNTPHILIIEEINRADPGAVFGDVFQLLDRDDSGNSEYSVHSSPELKNYLQKELTDAAKSNLYALINIIAERNGDSTEAQDCGEIAIPNNMYIWASMNSADQGVFPMDTAFKRRWAFQYLTIDGNLAEPKNADGSVLSSHWDEIRTNINRILKDEGQDIPEDKLLGRYFLSSDERTASNIVQAFSSKVIMYLFEDAARYCRSRIFKTDGLQGQLYLSDLLSNLDTGKSNLGIFAKPLVTLDTATEPEESDLGITEETAGESGNLESSESSKEFAA